jgi:hypothetical protein
MSNDPYELTRALHALEQQAKDVARFERMFEDAQRKLTDMRADVMERIRKGELK